MAIALAWAAPVSAQVVQLQRVGSFASPVHVAGPPGDVSRLFVVERAGRIQVVRNGQRLEQPFLDISGEVRADGERGLLSIAFAPDHETSRKLYFFWTDLGGDLHVDEIRGSADNPDRADPSTRRGLLVQEHSQFSNHNGGQLQIGRDRMLYVAFGDGGGTLEANGQRRDTWLGKLLRIDPTPSGASPYTVPGDNPFVGQAGVLPEIYAYGLRNPYRFSFDRQNGDLTIADVGAGAVEEVDFTPRGSVPRGEGAGANFGWSCFEGRQQRIPACTLPDHVPPVLERLHSRDGVCAITGGHVVRDPSLPALAGRYVYGDFCNAALRSAVLARPSASDDRPLGVDVPQLASFGEDAGACVYAVSLSGPVYRLAAAGQGAACPNPAQPLPFDPAPEPPPPDPGPSPPGPEPPPPGPGPAPPASDILAPNLLLRLAGGQRVLRHRPPGVVFLARCSEACSLRATGGVTIGASRRTLAIRSLLTRLAAGRTARLRLLLPRSVQRSIRGAFARRRTVSVAIDVRVRDRSGNLRTARRRALLRR